MEITHPEDRGGKKRFLNNEDNLGALWDNIKSTNTYHILVPEREEREKMIDN